MWRQIPYDPDSIFVDNPEPRCPCVLVLDRSKSMTGRPIEELNIGLWAFREELQQDALAARRVEVAIVSFGPVECMLPFTPAEHFTPPLIMAGGETPMGEAIITALDMIEERRSLYRSHGIPCYRPWVFLITDGVPTDDWEPAAARVRKAEEERRLAFFAVGVQGADLAVLRKIAVRTPLELDGLRFRDLFAWLSASLAEVSHSHPGCDVPLPPPGWAAV